jgi:hypothetical protein
MTTAPIAVDKLADRLTDAAELLTTVDRSVPGLAVAAGAFASDEAGVPGRIGRDLHAHWTAVLAARADEAARTAARLTDMAASVRAATRGYAETDEAAARRLERGSR